MSHVPPVQAVGVGEGETRVLLGNKSPVVVEVRLVLVFVKGVRDEDGEEVVGLVLSVPEDDTVLVLSKEDRIPEPELVASTKDLELLLNRDDEVACMLLTMDVEITGNTEDTVEPSDRGPSMMLPVMVLLPLGVGSRTKEGEVELVFLVLADALGRVPEDKAGSAVAKLLRMPLVTLPLGAGTLPVLSRDNLATDVEGKVGSAVERPSTSVTDDKPVMVGPASAKAVMPQQEHAEE